MAPMFFRRLRTAVANRRALIVQAFRTVPGPSMASRYRPPAGFARDKLARADMVVQGESSYVGATGPDRVPPSATPHPAATKGVTLEINPEMLAKFIEPHVERMSRKILQILQEEMGLKKKDSSVLSSTMRLASFVADSLIIITATLVLGVLVYFQLCPVEARNFLDGLVKDISRSALYGLTAGMFGETLAGKYLKSIEAKKREEEKKRRKHLQEEERRRVQDERTRLEEEYRLAVEDMTLYESILYRCDVGGRRWGGTRAQIRGRRWVVVDGVPQRW